MCLVSSYCSISFCSFPVPINMAVVVLTPLQNCRARLETTLWSSEALNSEPKWNMYFYRNVSFHFIRKRFVLLLFCVFFVMLLDFIPVRFIIVLIVFCMHHCKAEMLMTDAHDLGTSIALANQLIEYVVWISIKECSPHWSEDVGIPEW